MNLECRVAQLAQPDGQIPECILEDCEDNEVFLPSCPDGLDDTDQLVNLCIRLVCIVVIAQNQPILIVEVSVYTAGDLPFPLNQAQIFLCIALNHGDVLLILILVKMNDTGMGITYSLRPVGRNLSLTSTREEIVHRAHR